MIVRSGQILMSKVEINHAKMILNFHNFLLFDYNLIWALGTSTRMFHLFYIDIQPFVYLSTHPSESELSELNRKVIRRAG